VDTKKQRREKMSELHKIIHEQFLEYDKELKELEKEIIRKYKAGEGFSPADLTKASGLKTMKEECVRMMARKQ
jgi:predicted DNA-binding ArsR family transcriptional regulator